MSGRPRPTRYADRGDGSVFQRCDRAYGCPARVEQVQPDGSIKLVRPKHNCRGMWIGQAPPMYVDGRVRRPTVSARSKPRAKQKLRDLMERLGEHGYIPPATRATKTGEWINAWLEAASKDQLRNSTITRYRSVIRKWIDPALGPVPLQDLSPQAVKRLYERMAESGSAGSRSNVHSVLLGSLRKAVEDGVIHASPMARVPSPDGQRAKPKSKKKKNVGFTKDEWGRLLDVIEDRPVSERARWILQAYTGMRRSECLGLTWESVDLETGVITVEYQFTRITYEHGCAEQCGARKPSKCPSRVSRGANPDRIVMTDHAALDLCKTDGSERLIPMVGDLWNVLREFREVGGFPEFGGRHLLFHRDGRPVEQTRDDRNLREIEDAAGVARKGTHAFRRSVATRLMERKAPQRVIQAILGHASADMTMVYQDAEVEYVREVLSAVSDR